MTWKKEHPESLIETVFRSSAASYSDIAKDIQTVVARLVERQAVEKTMFEKNIFFLVNSTNGHVMISWYDPKIDDWIAGNWTFYLELPDLHHLCDSHEEGSQHFDNEVHYALCDTFQEYYVYEENPTTGKWEEYLKYRLFAWYEGNSEVQEIIV